MVYYHIMLITLYTHYSVLDDIESGRIASAGLRPRTIEDVAITIDRSEYEIIFGKHNGIDVNVAFFKL